jgi:hypothetical protein
MQVKASSQTRKGRIARIILREQNLLYPVAEIILVLTGDCSCAQAQVRHLGHRSALNIHHHISQTPS